MKRILVPTDFSINADKALNYAVQLAKEARAVIILLHVCDLLEITFNDNLALKKEYNRKTVLEAKKRLSLYKKSIEGAEKVRVQIKLFDGTITDSILQAAEKSKADMIIMGTLGNSGVKEKIIGSKTAEVIGKTTIPVLAIPLLSEWSRPSGILLAINSFTKSAKFFVSPVFELAHLFNAEIIVTKITKGGPSNTTDYLLDERKGNAFVKKLQVFHKKASIRFVHLAGHHFEKTIDKYMLANKADIIAMITEKRNLLKGIFHPSKTKKMSYHTAIPLLAIPV